MGEPLMDWSEPQKTPREPQQGRACREDAASPPAASSQPLSFWHSGGDIIWRGMNYLSLDEARDVRQIIIDELTFDRLSGGGVSGALGLLVEINTAINAARRWRQAQGGV